MKEILSFIICFSMLFIGCATNRVKVSDADIVAAEEKYSNGLTFYAQGKLFDAMQEWAAAVKLDPDHEKAYRALVMARKEFRLLKENNRDNKNMIENETIE